MSLLVMADVDAHLVAGINLVGLALGVLGSLFFTYDLLGRPGGPLRWFLRVTIPAALGGALVGVPVLLVGWGAIARGDGGWWLALGCFIYSVLC